MYIVHSGIHNLNVLRGVPKVVQIWDHSPIVLHMHSQMVLCMCIVYIVQLSYVCIVLHPITPKTYADRTQPEIVALNVIICHPNNPDLI